MAQNGYGRRVEAWYSDSREDQGSWAEWGREGYQIAQWYLKINSIVIRSPWNESFINDMSFKSYLFVFRHCMALSTPDITSRRSKCTCCTLLVPRLVPIWMGYLTVALVFCFESIGSDVLSWRQFPIWQDCKIELYWTIMWLISATTT